MLTMVKDDLEGLAKKVIREGQEKFWDFIAGKIPHYRDIGVEEINLRCYALEPDATAWMLFYESQQKYNFYHFKIDPHRGLMGRGLQKKMGGNWVRIPMGKR